MSKYNGYIKRANQIARNTFNNFRQAEAAYKKAKENAAKYPQRMGWVDAEYAAKQARATADLRDAELEFKKAKEAFTAGKGEFKKIREELAAELEDDYSATPDKLDGATLELLKSGIMKAGDYSRLYEKAKADGNSTMARIIGQYAGEAAETMAKKSGESQDTKTLRYVAFKSGEDSGKDYLAGFDSIAHIYDRCGINPAMIDHWDELTGEVVENF